MYQYAILVRQSLHCRGLVAVSERTGGLEWIMLTIDYKTSIGVVS